MEQKQISIVTLAEKIDNISRMALIGSKNVLDFDEAVLYTSLSRGYMYRLTSERRIPHFKKNRKLYFKKADLDEWMLSERVKTQKEIDCEATTYVVTHKRR